MSQPGNYKMEMAPSTANLPSMVKTTEIEGRTILTGGNFNWGKLIELDHTITTLVWMISELAQEMEVEFDNYYLCRSLLFAKLF